MITLYPSRTFADYIDFDTANPDSGWQLLAAKVNRINNNYVNVTFSSCREKCNYDIHISRFDTIFFNRDIAHYTSIDLRDEVKSPIPLNSNRLSRLFINKAFSSTACQIYKTGNRKYVFGKIVLLEASKNNALINCENKNGLPAEVEIRRSFITSWAGERGLR